MPLKREPEAVSSLPLGRIEGETVVSKGCQVGSKPSPGSYSSALLKKPLIPAPPATSTLPEGATSPGGPRLPWEGCRCSPNFPSQAPENPGLSTQPPLTPPPP